MVPAISSPALRTSTTTGGTIAVPGLRPVPCAVRRLARTTSVGGGEERALGLAQVACDRVEADAGQADDDLLLAVLWCDDDDLLLGGHHGAGGFGEPAVGGHVHRAAQVAGGELLRVAGVDHDGSGRLLRDHLVEGQRHRGVGGVEDPVLLAVEQRVVERSSPALRAGPR